LGKYKHAYGEKKKIKRAKVLFALAGQVFPNYPTGAGSQVPDQQEYPFICMGEKVHQLVKKVGEVDAMQVGSLTTLRTKFSVGNNRRYTICAVGWCHWCGYSGYFYRLVFLK